MPRSETWLLSKIDDSPVSGQRPIILDDAMRELIANVTLNGIIQPPLVLETSELIAGFRRVFAGKKAGIESTTVMVYPGDLSKKDQQLLRITENLLREDLDDIQKYLSAKELLALGLIKKDVASSLGVSASNVGKWFAPDDCSEQAREYFLARKLTLGNMYQISKSPQPDETMRLLLGGATREQITKKIRKPTTDTVRLSSIKVPLPSGAVVRLSGAEMNLSEALEAAQDAAKLIKKAIDKSLTAKTASAYWAETVNN